MMDAIPNKWVEKERKKKVKETAPAFETNRSDSWAVSESKPERFTHAARRVINKTLRGIRK